MEPTLSKPRSFTTKQEAHMAEHDSLKSLHTALIDARKGYETAYTDAKKPEMKSFFQSMKTLHEAAHDDVHKALTAHGETADEDGSFMATVHKTVISVRSATLGLDQYSLDSFADGEEKILEYYDDAIADDLVSSTTLQMLKKHRAALAGKIGEMRRKAA
jgi:uncharacterized protein (TIGR02284 family)